MSYAPPQLHWRDGSGRFHWRPFVYRRWFDFDPVTNQRVWREDRSKRYPLRLWAKGEGHDLLGLFKMERRLFGLARR